MPNRQPRTTSATLASLLWDKLCRVPPRTRFAALSPRASLQSGAAGVVWFALERARLNGDRRALTLAASWLTHIVRDAERDETAFLHERRSFNVTTLQYGVLTGWGGLAYLELLLGKALGDEMMMARGEKRLVTAWRNRKRGKPPLELFAGVAGYPAVVRDLANRGIASPALATIADDAYERLLHGLRFRISPSGESLGAAHGVVGMLLGALAWRAEPNRVLRARLDDLLALATVEDGIVALSMPPGDLWGSFCNGIPGAAILFDRAAHAFDEPRYARMAALAANTTHVVLPPVASLCCGAAGQAIALQHHARATRDPRFRRRARARLGHATRLASAEARTFNLWQGALGVAAIALAAEHRVPLAFPALG